MTARKPGDVYHATYHDRGGKGLRSMAAARSMLPMVFDVLEIRSVLDVGCGVGSWLAIARELGATELTGIEGEWSEPWERDEILPRSEFELVTQTLEDPFDLGRRFDLAICVEVAEHLSSSRASSFVAELCAASDQILFAAAIPGQGGIRHLNEQWQSYWAKLFHEHDYVALDVIRPRIWADESVPFWYRQNSILYLKNPVPDHVFAELSLPLAAGPERLDLVHPACYSRYVHPLCRRLEALSSALRKRLKQFGL